MEPGGFAKFGFSGAILAVGGIGEDDVLVCSTTNGSITNVSISAALSTRHTALVL